MSISKDTQEAIAIIIAALLLLAALLVIANHFRFH
jgi:cell division protein FtsX